MTELEIHPAFQGSGETPGLEIWRIEQLEPVRQDPKTYGSFYNGDAYLVLNTVQQSGREALTYDLHYWLGKYCSQDEAAAAAMRTVELDNMVLRGSAVQHREVQSHESSLFLSYFKSGVKYKEGGVESGLNTYDPYDYVKRLYQVKGKTNMRIEQVECKCGSLNQGDVFVLDDGPNPIWVWVGPYSETKEQTVGVEFAKSIRDDEKGGKAVINVVVEDWETNDDFYKALGSKDKTIRAADSEPDDDLVRKVDQDTLLFEIEEPATDGKKAVIKEVAERPLKQSMLDSNKCYVLDSGYSGLFVWTGKYCSTEFKQKVWDSVTQYLDSRGYPDWVTVTRVVDGGETALFKQYFESWEDPWDKDAEPQSQSNIAETDYSGAEGVDVESLHKPAEKAEEWMPDDGSGKITVYRVENYDLVKPPKEVYGVFFSGECYDIQYDYKDERDKDAHIVYFWQGMKSSSDDQGTSAAMAVKLDNDLNGEAVQVRVVMNKEPAHFMKLFKGRMVVLDGGKSSGFQSIKDFEGYKPTETYMFQIRATAADQTKAMQVTTRGASLNANDVFVVVAPGKIYIWIGKFSLDKEKEMAKGMVEHLAPGKTADDATIIEEGKETSGFWNAIDGEEDYYSAERRQGNQVTMPPRLFHCSHTSGRFRVEEIVCFVQRDLYPGDVFLLDTYYEIFVWVGQNASEFEKKESYKTAYNYLNTDPTGRTPDNTLIMVIRQGSEPPAFTSCFFPWNYDIWSEGKTFSEMVEEVGKENAGVATIDQVYDAYHAYHPLEVLQRKEPPPGVDVTKKERYLTDEDFKDTFGMTKDEYMTYAEWKRIEMKKEHGLF